MNKRSCVGLVDRRKYGPIGCFHLDADPGTAHEQKFGISGSRIGSGSPLATVAGQQDYSWSRCSRSFALAADRSSSFPQAPLPGDLIRVEAWYFCFRCPQETTVLGCVKCSLGGAAQWTTRRATRRYGFYFLLATGVRSGAHIWSQAVAGKTSVENTVCLAAGDCSQRWVGAASGGSGDAINYSVTTSSDPQ